MSVAIRRALYGKLSGDSTLTNQLGSPPTGYTKSIYYQLAPQEALFPYVIFQKQTGTPTYAFVAAPAFDTELWLIKGVDRNSTADPVDAIASRLDALLTDGVLTISGATQMYLRRQSDIDYSETHEGAEYKHSGSLFRLIYD
jgi:hypothetical protein